jgi:hypothetical protein
MTFQQKSVLLISVWIFLNCSTGDLNQKNPVENEQQLVAKKFITQIINNDYKTAYDLFSPKINEKYPFVLFEMVLNQNHTRFGHPISFSYQGETEVDPNIEKTLQKAAKSYVYLVVLKKEDKKQKIPLILTFGRDDTSNQLIAYKYLIDHIEPGGMTK